MLPDISIKIDSSPHVFIQRLEKIAKLFDNFKIKKRFNVPGFEGWENLIVDPRSSGSHEKLSGMVYSEPDSNDRVSIEVIAGRWNPDPPTYETYVAAARNIFEPLVKAYNKQYLTRLRLSIQAKSSKNFVLPPETSKRLKSFIVLANTSALHPLDWNRFYEFIAFCHAHHVKLSESQLRRLLVEGGFTEEKAEYLADIYSHGREMLTAIR